MFQESGSHLVAGIAGNVLGEKMDCRIQEEIQKRSQYAALLGKSVLTCHNPQSRQTIQRVIDWFAADKNHNLVYTYHNVKQNKDVYMVALRDADGTLIGYYEKHEYRSPETMKLYDME